MAINISIPYTGGTKSLKYSIGCTNDVVFSYSSVDWLTVTQDTENKKVTISATENSGEDDRTSVITPKVNGTSCDEKKITVTQGGKNCNCNSVEIDINETTVISDSITFSDSFSIGSCQESDVTFSSSESWIHVTRGDNSLTIEVDANDEFDSNPARSGYVYATINGDDCSNENSKVIIHQKECNCANDDAGTLTYSGHTIGSEYAQTIDIPLCDCLVVDSVSVTTEGYFNVTSAKTNTGISITAYPLEINDGCGSRSSYVFISTYRNKPWNEDEGDPYTTYCMVINLKLEQLAAPCNELEYYNYVKIGGVKWATMDMGATKVEEHGLLYAWGETDGYTMNQVGTGATDKYFGWVDYKYTLGCTDNCVPYKYNTEDRILILEPSDDIASVTMGDGWRMPSAHDYNILFNNTTKRYDENYHNSGVGGFVLSYGSKELFFPFNRGGGLNGRLLFVDNQNFHAAYYWTRERSSGSIVNNNPEIATCARFVFNKPEFTFEVDESGIPAKIHGYSIRACKTCSNTETHKVVNIAKNGSSVELSYYPQDLNVTFEKDSSATWLTMTHDVSNHKLIFSATTASAARTATITPTVEGAVCESRSIIVNQSNE